MKITFHGAAREVTGSCHLVEVHGRKILLDCGMIQGGKSRHERNREPFDFDPRSLDCVVLSHAHIDHSGRLPLLVKGGYRGPILTTAPTEKLCKILLADSGRIHEEDARWKIKRLRKKNKDFSWVTPLFTEEEGLAVLDHIVPLNFGQTRDIDGAGRVTFREAGHILGAGIVELELRDGDKTTRLTFSGDLGVHGARLIGSPEKIECPDYLLMESTYGNRQREGEQDRTEQLYDVIKRTIDRGGKVVIPSFAVGRTQEVMARINDLVEGGRLPAIPVYVDSPMAIAATKVFGLHPEAFSMEAREGIISGDEPLEFRGLRLTKSVEESIAINENRDPCVIISASGMATAGRIKHHLKHNIRDPNCTILFVGYQARNTLGQVIQSGIDPVRIFGDWYDVRAEVATIEGFSAHADLAELLEWFGGLGRVPRCTYVVHGEEQAALSLADRLKQDFSATVEVPARGQSFDLG